MKQGRDRPEQTELVITPAMIEAGVCAYMGWDHGDDPAEAIVADVFREMLLQSAREPCSADCETLLSPR